MAADGDTLCRVDIFFQKEKSLRAQLPFLPNVAHRFTDDNQLR